MSVLITGAHPKGRIRMRYVIPAMLACLLVGCGSVPPSSGSGCSTKSQCEIEAYMNAP
jgi:hypothetical protein